MKPKIAVIDLLLAYPPHGGAGVDLFNNFTRLQNNFDIKVFGITFEKLPAGAPQDFVRGILDKAPPLNCQLIDLAPNERRHQIIEKILNTVSAWNPELVFIADGWTLKPYLAYEFSKHFKTFLRLYAYEMLCPRNNQRWLFDHKCELNALDNPEQCLKCAWDYAQIVRKNRNGSDNPLTFEANLADIWNGDYHKTLSAMTTKCHFIVYNSLTKTILEKHNAASVDIIPGGVDPADFIAHTNKKQSAAPFKILAAGRMDDKAKGAATAIEAGLILKSKGLDFRMSITSQKKHNYEWLDEIGWQSKGNIIKLLAESDCALVPSLWDEAFGMTWAEAMAMNVPVIASNLGGPAEYIHDGKTGLLASPGNPNDLADKIMSLAQNQALCRTLAENGRHAVEEKFNWDASARKMAEMINNLLKK